jgi:hypothetical protein
VKILQLEQWATGFGQQMGKSGKREEPKKVGFVPGEGAVRGNCLIDFALRWIATR